MSEVPKHIAIVMDGNGRWAKHRNLPRVAGHRAGVRSLREVVRSASDMGVKALTVFAFSTENWGRPSFEVKHLARLFVEGLRTFVNELHEKNVRMRFIGDYQAFGPKITKRVQEAIERTAANTGLIYTIAINFSGRHDIARATRLVAEAVQSGELTVDNINEALVAQYMALYDVPPLDLFIRTGGETRISNFLLWQTAYAELYFSDLLWPDFGEAGLRAAISNFATRERRFGKTSEQVTC